MNIAVIGAGLAGVTVAYTLCLEGHQVTLFDKSKGTGGRISSRSVGKGWVDHGAPYLTAESTEFKLFLQNSPAALQLRSWKPEFSGKPRNDEQSHLIGVPRNSAVTRAFLDGCRFFPSTRVGRLEKNPSGWQLYNDGETRLGVWDTVVVAIPAPQALALLRNWPELADQVATARMEPCWVAAIQTRDVLGGLADICIYENEAVRRITRNSAKPGRNNRNLYLLQASKNWSLQHLEETAEEIGTELLRQFALMTGVKSPAELLFAHRWRYAFTERPLGTDCLWDPQLQLGVCGDWCLGRTAEDAWRSGAALAEKILQSCPSPTEAIQ